MSVDAILWKQAGDAIRRSMPDMLYLFDSFLRRKALRFRAISQDGTKFKRVTLTAALAVTCGAASYALYRIDPLDGLQGIMPSPERAFWTALVPLIAAFLAYWLMRWTLREPILPTFLNLGLVTCIALTVIPGILSLAGANASALASDIRQWRAGRGAGTPVHQIFCTTLEERAEIDALMRRLIRNSERLARNGRLLEANGRAVLVNTRRLQPNGQRLAALKAQIDQAGGPERVDPAIHQAFFDTVREGFPIVQRGMMLNERGFELVRQGQSWQEEGFAIHDRALELQWRQTTAPYRLHRAYPVATAFLVVAIVASLLMWVFSAVIAWKLTVSPQPTRKRKGAVGTALVLVFLLVSVGLSLLRSGLAEVFIQELPSREMMEAQLRSQFETATPMCGRLNNHGLW
ncbi:MAG TPA: hypothetical protein VN240_09795 [Propylenella sp.]|nr:hypothetical protein [Propylenella sp.]